MCYLPKLIFLLSFFFFLLFLVFEVLLLNFYNQTNVSTVSTSGRILSPPDCSPRASGSACCQAVAHIAVACSSLGLAGGKKAEGFMCSFTFVVQAT